MALIETVVGYGADADKPASPAEGWLYYSTDNNQLERYSGSSWQVISNDPDAIHDDVAAEINAVSEKTAPVGADLVLIEDSADSNNKKKAQLGNTPIDGGNVSNTANDDTTPGIQAVFPIAISGGAAGDTDITIDGKWRVIDVWAVQTGLGEANDTIQVKNGANAITDTMAWSGADETIVRASTINDANHEIADSGTLRVTTTDDDAGNDVASGIVYVTAMKVA